MDYHDKAVQLIEKLANAMLERNPNISLCFTIKDVEFVAEWLKDFHQN